MVRNPAASWAIGPVARLTLPPPRMGAASSTSSNCSALRVQFQAFPARRSTGVDGPVRQRRSGQTTGDERDSERATGFVDQQVNVHRRVDRADHDVGAGRKLGDAGRVAHPLTLGRHGGFGGVRRHPPGRRDHLGPADVTRAVDELPGEILDLDHIGVDQGDSSDAQAHQGLQDA
jgi:hypothetical protein